MCGSTGRAPGGRAASSDSRELGHDMEVTGDILHVVGGRVRRSTDNVAADCGEDL